MEEEVFDTRDRTGTLLFVSLRGHRIEVLRDRGISQRVRPDDWAEVMARIRRGVRNDNLTEGRVEAIKMCGRLLDRRGVGLRPDDENELSNTVRTPDSPEEERPGDETGDEPDQKSVEGAGFGSRRRAMGGDRSHYPPPAFRWTLQVRGTWAACPAF